MAQGPPVHDELGPVAHRAVHADQDHADGASDPVDEGDDHASTYDEPAVAGDVGWRSCAVDRAQQGHSAGHSHGHDHRQQAKGSVQPLGVRAIVQPKSAASGCRLILLIVGLASVVGHKFRMASPTETVEVSVDQCACAGEAAPCHSGRCCCSPAVGSQLCFLLAL